MNKCVICGKEFEPVYNMKSRQKTCSRECRAIMIRENSRIYKKQYYVREKHLAYMRNHNKKAICRLCGKPIFRDYTVGIIARTQMHDECVFEDCAKTLKAGERLTTAQYQRLASRGYGVREFREEWNV